VTVFAANHLSLIRSFLLDFVLRRRRARQIVQNYFALHTSAIDMQTRAKKMRAAENYAHACASRANFARARNPYFIVTF